MNSQQFQLELGPVALGVSPQQRAAERPELGAGEGGREAVHGAKERTKCLGFIRSDKSGDFLSPKVLSHNRWRYPILILWVLAGVGLALFVLISGWMAAQSREDTLLTEWCYKQRKALVGHLSANLDTAAIFMSLVKVQYAMKQSNPSLSRDDWALMADESKTHRPLQFALTYCERVSSQSRAGFEQKWNHSITSILDGVKPRPSLDVYAPIVFTERSLMNAGWLFRDCMDPSLDINLRPMMLNAMATGQLGISQPFYTFNNRTTGGVALAFMFPFAVNNYPTNATADVYYNLTAGFVGGIMSFDQVVQSAMNLTGDDQYEMRLYDVTTNANHPLLLWAPDLTKEVIKEPFKKGYLLPLAFSQAPTQYLMSCYSSGKTNIPWSAIAWALLIVVITVLLSCMLLLDNRRIALMQRQYKRMEELKSHAEAADRAKSMFLCMFSHEVRTPINAVLGCLSLLADTKLDPTQYTYAMTAHDNGSFLCSLITDVLDLAKAESGKMEIEHTAFEIRLLVENILACLGSNGKAKGKDIEFAGLVGDAVPNIVVGDPGKLRQVLVNLISNSFKFTTNGGHILVCVRLVKDSEEGAAFTPPGGARSLDQESGLRRRNRSMWSRLVHHSSHYMEDKNSPLLKDLPGEPAREVPAYERLEDSETLSGRQVADRSCSWGAVKSLVSLPPLEGSLLMGQSSAGTDTSSDATVLIVREEKSQSSKLRLHISVEDTGAGIPYEVQDKIFRPFVQASAGSARQFGGTGIGLAISKHLVGLMGGRMWFVSKPGVGTTFHCEVCLEDGQGAALAAGLEATQHGVAKSPIPDVESLEGKSVLVLDSNKVRQAVCVSCLKQLEMEPLLASSVEEAQLLLKSSGPLWQTGGNRSPPWAEGPVPTGPLVDVVLVDTNACGPKSGFSFAPKLKEAQPAGKFVLLGEEEEIAALSAGFHGLVRKPLRSTTLASTLVKVLNGATKAPAVATPGDKAKKREELQAKLKGKQVLVCDDVKVNLFVAKKFLEKLGLTVVTVDGGQAAIDKLQPGHAIDAVFMDIQMPTIDGYEASRRIRRSEEQAGGAVKKVPILAMTADVLSSSKEDAFAAGMTGFVTKPITEDSLSQAVQAALL